MDRNPKRKGSVSRDQDLTSTKRARWEAELAGPPSESSPTASGSALVHSAQVHGGALTVVGRDNNNTTIHNYYYLPQNVSVDVLDILNSLSLPNFRDIQLDTLAKATDGTCVWLTAGEMFVFWVANGKILWGIGIPGAGKTVLASIVIRYLQGLENTSGGAICIAYVYLRYSEPLAIRDILESLVKQIVERHDDLIPFIEALYARHKKEGTKPSQDELREVLETFIWLGKTLFFVLDGFDEMRDDDRAILLKLLVSLDAKFLITSRPLEPLQKQFPDARVFNIAASPSDLDLHIKQFLRHSPEVMALLEGTDLESQIAETIHRKSGGMFLHAKLQLEVLRNCVSGLDVEEALQGFPSDIEAIYTKTWERILAQGSKQSSLAKLVLLWITHANGEMTIDTLRCAVATCPETYAFEPKRMVPEALLLSACFGLISVNEKTRRVRLIHYTTRDAILPRILDLFPVPHALLGHVCIVHVTKSDLQHFSTETGIWKKSPQLDALFCNDPLLAYAHRSWAHHTRQCSRYTPITSAAADLVLNCTSYPLGHRWPDFGGPIHIAVFYGLEDLIPLAAQVHSPNSRTTCSAESPLMLAVRRGHLACTKALLSLPGIDVDFRDRGGSNALLIAATCGQIEFVQLLSVFPGTNINTTELVGKATALIHAAAGGHIEVAKLLIRLPGTDLNAADSNGWTALMHAVHDGHAEVVRELLSAQKIDVNSASIRWGNYRDNERTALMLAALKGYISIVKQLLEFPGINVNAISFPFGKTALSYALAAGHREVADLLLAFPGITVPASPNWIQN